MTTTTPSERAEGVHWDLTHILSDEAAATDLLSATNILVTRFADHHRGNVGALDGPGLRDALADLAAIENALSRVSSYAHLRESIDSESEANRDLVAKVDQALVEVGNQLRFFELEWVALPDEVALPLANAPEVAADRHFLISQRRFAPHVRTEQEEEMLAERQTAAVRAWQTLFGRVTSTLEIPFDDGGGEEPHTVDRLLAYVRRPDRDLRHRALAALYAGLAPHAPTLAHCYDTLVADRLTMDRLRSYEDPMDPTHLRNELPRAAVTRMLERVEAAYPLAQRWFRVKGRLLGIEPLHLADQYAPIGEARPVAFDEGRVLVEEAFARFSPEVAEVAKGIMGTGRLDAEPRVGKRGGAFCAPVSQDGPIYVLMNYNDRFQDVVTLAHELGHAMHFQLSQGAQSAHSAYTGLALAEVPSTFAESVTLDHVLATETDPQTRRTLVCEHVEGVFASVFRQTVLARYEQRAYAARAAGQSLSDERLGDIWLEENRRYYGDSVELPEAYGLGWSYIPHFISTRFYTYAYVFASLVALTLHARQRADTEAFMAPYLEFLTRGGSAPPAELLRPLGIDLDDPDVWEPGIAELERLVEEAERVAGEA